MRNRRGSDYVGYRTLGGLALVVFRDTNPNNYTKQIKRIKKHSSVCTGMEWGYGGDGPANTALSILTDFFERQNSMPRRLARKKAESGGLYQKFKKDFLVQAPHTRFEICVSTISEWIRTGVNLSKLTAWLDEEP